MRDVAPTAVVDLLDLGAHMGSVLRTPIGGFDRGTGVLIGGTDEDACGGVIALWPLVIVSAR